MLAGASYLIIWHLTGRPDPGHGMALIGLVLVGLVTALAAVQLLLALLYYVAARRHLTVSTATPPDISRRALPRGVLAAMAATILALGASALLSGAASRIASWAALAFFATAIVALTRGLLTNLRSLLTRQD